MASRTGLAILALLASIAVSVAVYLATGYLFVFLAVPFVPFLFRGWRRDDATVRTCPACGFRTTDDAYDYCPRDGTRLE